MTSAFGGQRSIQLSYGCLVARARSKAIARRGAGGEYWKGPACANLDAKSQINSNFRG